VSVSDSLCSGVLRGEYETGTVASAGTNGTGGNSLGGKTKSSYSMQSSPPVAGGVADFNRNYVPNPSNEYTMETQNYVQKPSNEYSEYSLQSMTSSGTGPSMAAMSVQKEEDLRREQRKERVKEKLDRYKRDQKLLKHSCVALEQQLAQTTEKLREVDSRAAFKIDSLESELRETRMGMERVAKTSTKEVTDQSECIKTLGKKLIRQAHVIKRQKGAVDEYKVRLRELQDELRRQDERESRRAEEYCELKDRYDNVVEQKVQIQSMLQENIEEMMDLKSETERDAKNIMELEFNLQQKDATLDRVAKEVSEKATQISSLEDELEGKNREMDGINDKLKESETSVDNLKNELESFNSKVEEWSNKYSQLEEAFEQLKKKNEEMSKNISTGGDENNTNERPSLSSVGDSATHSAPDLRPSLSSVGRSASVTAMSHNILNSWKRDSVDDPDTFESELQAKDSTIETLDSTVKEHEATIQSLRSDMVKMSSTYKQDSYLKRKEIAQLKQKNAEYALKLRALEKAFKCVNAAPGTNNMNSSTMHGAGGTRLPGSSMHGSLHGKSMHSVGSRTSVESREDRGAAVKARLGLAPYEFPSAPKDSQIVLEANFFDGDGNSGDERKGEFPEEH